MNATPRLKTSGLLKGSSEKIVEIYDEDELSIIWRKHFVDTMKPRFLPKFWRAEKKDHYRMRKSPKDPMGDRMKGYESIETHRCLDKELPIIVRLDGHAFSTFTRGLKKPYDERLSRLMIETMKFLIESTGAVIGYSQSDEITLLYFYGPESEALFGGKVHKITSLFAGQASSKFSSLLKDYLPEKLDEVPCFDARAFNVPTREEGANSFLWRWLDARKNSVSMLAQSVFSHKALQGKSTAEMKEMLLEKGYDWDEQPEFFKWGTFARRVVTKRTHTPEELAAIPEAHRNGEPFFRSSVVELDVPPFINVYNRTEFLFDATEAFVVSNEILRAKQDLVWNIKDYFLEGNKSGATYGFKGRFITVSSNLLDNNFTATIAWSDSDSKGHMKVNLDDSTDITKQVGNALLDYLENGNRPEQA